MSHRLSRTDLGWKPAAATTLALLLLAPAARAASTAPVLYRDAFRQSPVRADPGDLLMIAGSGFRAGDRVVYQRVTDTTSLPGPPLDVPEPRTAESGEAVIVLRTSDALTIEVPDEMTQDQSYVFRVRNFASQWSEGVLVNDARPLWISPDRVHVSRSVAGLPRHLKVIGRNLHPVPGQTTQIRLTGPFGIAYTLSAQNDANPATAIERYAAVAALPVTMTAGTYSVEVCRDGQSWVSLAGQQLVVVADPAAAQEFPVGTGLTLDPHQIDLGTALPCEPDDGLDDTACIQAAITAASAQGGVVTLGKGTWDLGVGRNPAPDKSYGLLLPPGVSLAGAGSALTTLLRGATWDAPPLFTLLGSNEVRDIRFQDAVLHGPGDEADRERSFLQIGRTAGPTSWGDPTVVDTLLIHGNVFDNAIACIRDGGFPIQHLYLAGNEFGGWHNGIYFAGPWYTETSRARFDLQDSIIHGNTFKPGGYVDPAGTQGPIASEIGAAYRLDFSENVIDGHARDYLYGAPAGFRAGFFFHMANDHEMTLLSRNHAACTGDRAGDGEFASYDNNGNSFGTAVAAGVLSATAATITVAGPLRVRSPANYYDRHWVQVVSGTGLGQARKITSYAVDGQSVTFDVAPAWDVPPNASSKVTVGREVWQLHVVDNVVDNTGCTLAAGHPDYVWRPESGEISLFATMADSAVEGNLQIGTDGIIVQTNYSSAPDFVDQNLKLFVEIRGNTILGEVNHAAYCSWSGIILNYGTSQSAESPVLGFGVSIGRNTVRGADGLRGGAIVAENGYWWPKPGFAVLENLLIHNNAVQELGNDPPGNVGPKPDGTFCDIAYPHRRGIHLHAYPGNGYAIARTVLKGNVYPSELVCRFLDDGTTAVVNLDPEPSAGWCPVP